MGQTIVEKIAQKHMAEGPTRPLRAGDFLSIRPHRSMTHDNTSAVMSKFKGIGAKKIKDPRQLVFALDHDIQNQDESNLKKYRSIEAFAKEQGVDFYPAGSGIGHQIMVERGYVVPGSFVVASDSHSNMYGALGAVGTPIVRTDAAAVWATGEFWWQIPRSIQVVLEGKLPEGATGKDVIITLCGLYNHDECLNAAVEFTGPGVASLSMDARLSISNMTTEWGPLVGWFPVDAVTIAYHARRSAAAEGDGRRAFFRERHRELGEESAGTGRGCGLCRAHRARPRAGYAARFRARHGAGYAVAGRDREEESRDPEGVPDFVREFAGGRSGSGGEGAQGSESCLGDVKFYLAAASKWVQEEAEKRGIWQTLLDAGAQPLPSGCGPCIGLGVGLLEAGEVGISSTNRNFKGRMGSRDAQCYLASPEVVAASAVAGYICSPDRGGADKNVRPTRNITELAATAGGAEKVEILAGFPQRVKGRLVFMPQDNVNTDAIYGKDYTYRDDMTPEMMAKVVMENYDPQFAARTEAGDVIVSGFNFGTGSSREQAVTCLKAKGILLVIAASFSQTYLRNAFNNGFLCIEVPEFVARVREQFATEIAAKEKTIIPGDEIDIDFTASTITWRGEKFTFPALGSVPQSLVIAGGVENLVAKRLGLA